MLKAKIKTCYLKEWLDPNYYYHPNSPKADLIRNHKKYEWMDVRWSSDNKTHLNLCGWLWERNYFIIKEFES